MAPEIGQSLLVDLVPGPVVTLGLGVVGESGCGFFQAVAPSDCVGGQRDTLAEPSVVPAGVAKAVGSILVVGEARVTIT